MHGRDQKGDEELKADLLLVAVGRGPVTEGAGLDAAGVEVDDRGFVTVDEYCRTNVDGHLGRRGRHPDARARPRLVRRGLSSSPTSSPASTSLPIDYKGVPRVTYSHPEVASVGYTEAQAKDAGFEVVTESTRSRRSAAPR